MRTLHLTLDFRPFEVMVTGEKKYEFRLPSEWIKRRLYDTNGNLKEYDQIRFVNGYGSDKPWFTCKWTGSVRVWKGEPLQVEFSNGLQVPYKIGMYVIGCGEITGIGNYEIPKKS